MGGARVGMHVYVGAVVGELGENSDSYPPTAIATLDTHTYTKRVDNIPRSFDHSEMFKKFGKYWMHELRITIIYCIGETFRANGIYTISYDRAQNNR